MPQNHLDLTTVQDRAILVDALLHLETTYINSPEKPLFRFQLDFCLVINPPGFSLTAITDNCRKALEEGYDEDFLVRRAEKLCRLISGHFPDLNLKYNEEFSLVSPLDLNDELDPKDDQIRVVYTSTNMHTNLKDVVRLIDVMRGDDFSGNPLILSDNEINFLTAHRSYSESGLGYPLFMIDIAYRVVKRPDILVHPIRFLTIFPEIP